MSKTEFVKSDNPTVRAYRLQPGDIFEISEKYANITILKRFGSCTRFIDTRTRWIPIFKCKILRWLKKPMRYVVLEWLGEQDEIQTNKVLLS